MLKENCILVQQLNWKILISLTLVFKAVLLDTPWELQESTTPWWPPFSPFSPAGPNRTASLPQTKTGEWEDCFFSSSPETCFFWLCPLLTDRAVYHFPPSGTYHSGHAISPVLQLIIDLVWALGGVIHTLFWCSGWPRFPEKQINLSAIYNFKKSFKTVIDR